MPSPLENEKDPLYVPASSFARALTLSLSLPPDIVRRESVLPFMAHNRGHFEPAGE